MTAASGISLGRVFGFPVQLDPSALVLAALVAFSGLSGGSLVGSAIFLVAILVSILVHELGHAFVVRAMGWDAEIIIHGFGGVTLHRSQPTPLQQVGISVAGPAMNALLMGLSLVGGRFVPAGWGTHFLEDLFTVNLFLGLFNLLPIVPLDGGQAFRAFLQMVTPRRAILLTAWLSLALCVGLVAYAYSERWLFLGLIALFLAAPNYQEVRGQEA